MNFTKMHALGNDFIVIDCITQNLHLTPEAIKKLSDRHTGIGFDQLLLVEPPYSPDVDFHLRIYHSDGSELEQCANGARCFARFVKQKNLTKKRDIKVSTMKGVMELTLNSDETVTVNMGEPNFDPKLIPFVAQKEEKNYIIRTQHSTVLCGVVSIGHPHCVIQVDKTEQAEVTALGSLLEQHDRFPAKTNVGFMEIVDRSRIKLRVYEREVGETHSISGNSASSAVAVGIYQGQLDAKVKIELQGGALQIEWQGKGKPLYMTGPATFIFDGFISI